MLLYLALPVHPTLCTTVLPVVTPYRGEEYAPQKGGTGTSCTLRGSLREGVYAPPWGGHVRGYSAPTGLTLRVVIPPTVYPLGATPWRGVRPP